MPVGTASRLPIQTGVRADLVRTTAMAAWTSSRRLKSVDRSMMPCSQDATPWVASAYGDFSVKFEGNNCPFRRSKNIPDLRSRTAFVHGAREDPRDWLGPEERLVRRRQDPVSSTVGGRLGLAHILW